MYSNRVNRNLTTQLTRPATTLSLPDHYKNVFRYILSVLTLALILLVSTSYERNGGGSSGLKPEFISPAATAALRGNVTDPAWMDRPIIHGDRILAGEGIAIFYRLNDYKPVWTCENGLSRRAGGFLELIEQARYYGLEPGHYHLTAIRDLMRSMDDQTPTGDRLAMGTELELLITDAALSFMVNLQSGYRALDTSLFVMAEFADLPAVLYHGVRQDQVREKILSVQPQFIEYQQLQEATGTFVRAHSLTGECTVIQYPVQDSGRFMEQVREALIAQGYLKNNRHDQDVAEALRQFQHFHGLEPDGEPGINTVEALGQSTLFKYRKLALNLDRLRKQESFDSTWVYVNIPAYQLRIYSRNSLKDTFRVIVGQPSSPTPQLTARMEAIITNPVWFVPKSITMNEILPKIKADTGYLRKNGFRILDDQYRTVNERSLDLGSLSGENFNYTLRQNRGSDNALGKVKFIFPNPYAIYLHDTPGKALFAKDIRAFSHGCIRIKDPERFAGYILHEINKDDTDMTALIRNGQHREINIAADLPIQIRYITCEGDGTGNLYFYKDIYGIDEKELLLLQEFMGI
jgi:L,D-transpeptidase YcbB